MPEACNRLLSGEATLGEGDMGLVEPRLGGKDRLVDLLPPRRRSSLDPQRLELPGILAFLLRAQAKTWMAGTSPAMTERMNNQLSPGALANALSTTSPIGSTSRLTSRSTSLC